MTEPAGAAVVIVGAGASGLSAGWWLARAGVDALVLDKGIAGWEASGRNGGGCTHHFSPLFAEEQRLWPVMDELLGYPTEFRPGRIRIAFTARQMQLYGRRRCAGWCHWPGRVRRAATITASAAMPTRTARCKAMLGPCRTMAGV